MAGSTFGAAILNNRDLAPVIGIIDLIMNKL